MNGLRLISLCPDSTFYDEYRLNADERRDMEDLFSNEQKLPV